MLPRANSVGAESTPPQVLAHSDRRPLSSELQPREQRLGIHTQVLDRAGKGEFVPIGIAQVEITFAPRGILRHVGTKAVFAKVRPKAVNIRNVEDKPTPANSGLTFFEVQNGSALCYP